MRKSTILVLAIFLAVLSSWAISGESVQTQLIPAEAKWLVHIDVAKFAQSELRKTLETHSKKDFSSEILGIEKKIGIDFFNDIAAVTLIGMNHENKEPVIAISGRLDKAHLLGLLEEEESLKEIPYGTFLIYNWDDDGFGTFATDNLLIFSENRRGLEKVLDSFSGKGKNFSGTYLEKQIRALSPDTFLTAMAENVSALLDEDDDDFGALILQKTKSAIFSANEQNGSLGAQLSLETDSAETATNLESMVTGLKAFLSMNEEIDPEWDIIKSFNITVKGTTVVLRSQGSIEELIRVLMGKL